MNTKLFKIFDKILSTVVIFLMGAMTAIVIISVFCRYLLSVTFIWSEELVSMIFITSSFLGCVIAVKDREHISVSFVVDALPNAIQKILNIISKSLIIFIQGVMIKYSIEWISIAGVPLSPGLRIPLGVFYSVMPISSGLIIMYEILEIINIITRKKVMK
ncbi:hypothetical protein Z968_01405 [Clostridium novyi A str. 4552]|uniref:Tripartite ATP-independent periplasmic transporters DctQ component domain-containing protein n=1 Tax=Clostridium novyi A str. 4552 TaxID=1444289 RepID=A0A0A0IBU5_CLONO|nr:TRAP transporter small permease [Clostridium novyi]KGM98008.1 hypothetical protein Z968_01405 [Clostridium novyi A str. 4552]